MADAKVCDRCGRTFSSRFNINNAKVKWQSTKKWATFIGAYDRNGDLCRDCRHDLDVFMGVKDGEYNTDPKEV